MIEKLKESDIEKIAEIEKTVFEKEPWPLRYFKQELANEVASIYVLKQQDEIIGYYDIWQMFENVDITNIAVKKEKQGQGFGEYLLKDLLIRCLKQEVEFVHLEVRVSNLKAINLYKKFGFEEVRIRKNYYQDEDAIDMMKGLIGLSEKDIGN